MFFKNDGVFTHIIFFPTIKTPGFEVTLVTLVTRQGWAGFSFRERFFKTSYDVGNWNDQIFLNSINRVTLEDIPPAAFNLSQHGARPSHQPIHSLIIYGLALVLNVSGE